MIFENFGMQLGFEIHQAKNFKWQSSLSILLAMALGSTPRLDFSHYFRWLFANFRECSLIS